MQGAWREEIKNVLIWSTGLSKEQQGRCLSSPPGRRDQERKQIPEVLTGATSRDAVAGSTRSLRVTYKRLHLSGMQKDREGPGAQYYSPEDLNLKGERVSN